MATYELQKSVDCVKLNKRSGIPTGEKKSLAFGAILVYLGEDRDNFRFLYLGELYEGPQSEMKGYLRHLEGDETVNVGKLRVAESGGGGKKTHPQSGGKVQYKVIWDKLSSEVALRRAKIPGGWLIAGAGDGITFLPDPAHEWNGESLP
jgi:hypothetical protein